MSTTGISVPTQAGDCADHPSSRAADEEHGQLALQFFPEIEAVSAGNDDQQIPRHGTSDFPESVAAANTMPADMPVAMTVGQRLRSERERRGWTRDDVAAKLKWQAGLVRRIEEDDYQGIQHAVYLRGYLGSYTRLLGLPTVIAEHVVASHAQETPLVSTGTISRSRYLLDRYSVSATYLILTGLVIGPAVWLATHGGLEQNLARTVLLDTTTSTTNIVAAADTTPDVSRDARGSVAEPDRAPLPQPLPVTPEPTPIIASMAPFPAMPQASATSIPTPAVARTVTLKLKQSSWVEVTSASGEKLEYSLLAAGTERSYSSNGVVSVRIGNAEGAEILVDGKAIDLAPYRRANVAHLQISGDGARAIRADS